MVSWRRRSRALQNHKMRRAAPCWTAFVGVVAGDAVATAKEGALQARRACDLDGVPPRADCVGAFVSFSV